MSPGFAAREGEIETQFSLGRLGLPVNIIAVVFGAFFLVDIGWPRAAVYGSKFDLQYFAPIFVLGCAVIGVISYYRAKQRDRLALEETLHTPLPARGHYQP